MSAIRPATTEQATSLDRALRDLRRALDCLKAADAPRAADKVRAAIKSAEGARRHIAHRLNRSQESIDAR